MNLPFFKVSTVRLSASTTYDFAFWRKDGPLGQLHMKSLSVTFSRVFWLGFRRLPIKTYPNGVPCLGLGWLWLAFTDNRLAIRVVHGGLTTPITRTERQKLRSTFRVTGSN